MSENQTTNKQIKKMTYRAPIIITLPYRQSWWKRWCCFPWKTSSRKYRFSDDL